MSSSEPVYTEVITFKDFEMERWGGGKEKKSKACFLSVKTLPEAYGQLLDTE